MTRADGKRTESNILNKEVPDYNTKTIHISYFSCLKESCGLAEETVETIVSLTGDLFDELSDRYNFPLTKDALKVSVNDTFSSWEAKLKSGDHVVFIPPVSGG